MKSTIIFTALLMVGSQLEANNPVTNPVTQQRAKWMEQEVQHIVNTSDKAHCPQRIEQYVRQQQQMDPLQQLPAVVAQAYALKLDSVVYAFDRKYCFEYDTETKLLTYYTREDWNHALGCWEKSETYLYAYDAQNRVTERYEERYSGGVLYWDYQYLVEYQDEIPSLIRKSSTRYTNYQENGEVASASGSIYEYDQHGWETYYGEEAYSNEVGFYLVRANETDYDYERSNEYSKYISAQRTYSCPNGSYELEPSSRRTYEKSGIQKYEVYKDGEWLVAYQEYFDEADPSHKTLISENYELYFGEYRLVNKTIVRRYGWDPNYFGGNYTRCETAYYYDENGRVSSGKKVDYIHGWGMPYEQDYYDWDNDAMDWVLVRVERIDLGIYDYHPSEGEKRTVVEYGSDMSSASQTYHNGEWVTTSYWGSEYTYYTLDGINYSSKNTLHSLYFDYDLQRGEYTHYTETFYTYEGEQLMLTEEFAAPERKNPTMLDEYEYDGEGLLQEIKHSEQYGTALELVYVERYEYGEEDLSEVLHPNNTQLPFGYIYDPTGLSKEGRRPMSVKRYGADGTLMQDVTLWYYSRLDAEVGMQGVRPEAQTAADTRYYNLQGQRIVQPQRGQIVIGEEGKRIVD